MSVRELVAEYCSPLWMADVERFRSNLRRFAAAWQREWPNTRIAYRSALGATPGPTSHCRDEMVVAS